MASINNRQFNNHNWHQQGEKIHQDLQMLLLDFMVTA